MNKIIVALLMLISLSAASKTMDESMAKVYGTCTPDTCPPGTKVSIDAKPGDTSDALDMNGKSYDLLQMKKLPLTVITDDEAENHSREAKVVTNAGVEYYIQWMFLKKK